MIINGKEIAKEILDQLQTKVANLSFQPMLVDVVIGNDPVSLSYVRIKQKTAERIGVEFQLVQLAKYITQAEVVRQITELQQQPRLSGLIVQLPLPESLDANEILSAIHSNVDVDLLSPEAQQKFYNNQSDLVPPTPAAILEVINSLQLENRPQVVVMGQGELVGKPITHLLRQQGYEVTTIDNETADAVDILKQAKLLITGIGKPKLVTADMLSSGVCVIDAGTSESGGSIAGDIDFDSVGKIAQAITPVPGGVGPVTVAKLLENVLICAKAKN